ncbi:MAG: tetratricopeptide repeat protein, partial [Candidatus Eiseniibacteriota bacterium]
GPSDVSSPAEAVASAQAGVADRPEDPEAWFRLGLAWQRSGGVEAADSARSAYEKVTALAPGRADALVHRGLVLEELNRHAEAEANYRSATEVAPQDAVPWVNLGALLYFHYKKTFEAKSALVKALELDPQNADAHFNLGVLFADANLFAEAQVEWEKVLELAPESPAGALARNNLEQIRPLGAPPAAP